MDYPGRMAAAQTSATILIPTLIYDDAPAAIDFLCRAFGFEKRLVVPAPDGGVMHSELSLGPGVIMVGSPKPALGYRSPRTLGGVHGGVCVHVADVDAHCARARAAGAEIVKEPKDEEYGARGYQARDPEGHSWYFSDYVPGGYW
jgi:uncharacterized glyoxalase superfamily protein PhnB